MPLSAKDEKILDKMRHTYGQKKGESVFYASVNKGTIKADHPKTTKDAKKK